MKREVKYPDTDVFKYYNANPKGRFTGDCVDRALCTALDEDYDTVVKELSNLQCQTGYSCHCKECYDLYLKSKGFVKMKQPRKPDNTKYTGKEFCEELQSGSPQFDVGSDSKRIVAHIGGSHVVAIVDHKICDTWNSSKKCIGNYWVRG